MSEDETVIDQVAALKHDLAKYVAWRTANYDAAAWNGPLTVEFVADLVADLLETSHGKPAWVVWDEHARRWEGSPSVPELVKVAAAVETLRALEPALRARDVARLGPARPSIAQAQNDIREALRDLHRRLLRERYEGEENPSGGA